MTTSAEERPPPDPRLILENWRNELDSADLYTYLAARERDSGRAEVLLRMAEGEKHHAAVMERGLQQLGLPVPRHRLSFKTRAMKLLTRLFGPSVVYPILQGTEISGTTDYAAQSAATAALASEERAHARVLSELSRRAAAQERWHHSGAGGALRAAIFGVNDGLVSNLSLVMGFAGAQADAKFVLLAGLAGLLAGASSMAAGEYVSMRSQRELFERQIDLEKAELAVVPGEEQEELTLIYQAKGLPRAEAELVVGRIMENETVALETLVREELGLDPQKLGSPWAAAIGSFLAFAAGAILPVLPYFTGADWPQVIVSCLIAGGALFAVGAGVSLFTGRNAVMSGLRQLAIGAAAATITFAIGRVIGISADI
jgi:VIT1/CCC1 family predicted Fe2+/Mn2+ transporter